MRHITDASADVRSLVTRMRYCCALAICALICAICSASADAATVHVAGSAKSHLLGFTVYVPPGWKLETSAGDAFSLPVSSAHLVSPSGGDIGVACFVGGGAQLTNSVRSILEHTESVHPEAVKPLSVSGWKGAIQTLCPIVRAGDAMPRTMVYAYLAKGDRLIMLGGSFDTVIDVPTSQQVERILRSIRTD